MENQFALKLRTLTPFNYMDWRGDTKIVLRNNGMYMGTMGKEVKPQQDLEKSKYLNKLDESFGFMCIYIYTERLFLDGLKTPREVWFSIESLFKKKDDLGGHIL